MCVCVFVYILSIGKRSYPGLSLLARSDTCVRRRTNLKQSPLIYRLTHGRKK